jgi:hypothetical protein
MRSISSFFVLQHWNQCSKSPSIALQHPHFVKSRDPVGIEPLEIQSQRARTHDQSFKMQQAQAFKFTTLLRATIFRLKPEAVFS